MLEDELLQLKLALKKQSLELEKRALIIATLEEELHEVTKNMLLVSTENKKLEIMLHAAKDERRKFIEDNQNLQALISINELV